MRKGGQTKLMVVFFSQLRERAYKLIVGGANIRPQSNLPDRVCPMSTPCTCQRAYIHNNNSHNNPHNNSQLFQINLKDV